MKLSIVTTLYHSAPYIQEFYNRIKKQAERITKDYEIIFVNDGSPDNSLNIVLNLYKNDPKIKIIDLSRNFGHHVAMITGLAFSRGSYVFLIDSDLEEEPELLLKFYNKMMHTDADVIFGVQKKRKGNWFERVSGGIFWNLFNMLSSYPVPKNQLVTRFMTRRYVDSLLQHSERELFLPGLWAITGFKQIPVVVKKHCKGSSTYTFKKKIDQFVNAVTSFSVKPLLFIFYLGALIIIISSSFAIWLIIKRIFFSKFLAGWPSLIVSIWLLGGITIFCVGLIGIYLSKVFIESKQRPRAIIRRIYSKKGKQNLSIISNIYNRE